MTKVKGYGPDLAIHSTISYRLVIFRFNYIVNLVASTNDATILSVKYDLLGLV